MVQEHGEVGMAEHEKSLEEDAMHQHSEGETSVTADAALLLHQQQQQLQQLQNEAVGNLTGAMSLEGFMKDDQQPDYIKDEQSEYDHQEQSAEDSDMTGFLKEDNSSLKLGAIVGGLAMPDSCSGWFRVSLLFKLS